MNTIEKEGVNEANSHYRLEKALRNFSTLTVEDIIQINYNDKIYGIKVLGVKPFYEDHSGISIVETDLEVDFAPPIGYVESSQQTQTKVCVCYLFSGSIIGLSSFFFVDKSNAYRSPKDYQKNIYSFSRRRAKSEREK